MLVKRPMYNHQLKCVAFEILSPDHLVLDDDNKAILNDLILKADPQLPLFLPFALKDTIEQFTNPIENPIILKLDASDVESTYSLKELEESAFSIALLISSPQQLAWLNFADYVGLTEQLLDSSDLTKVVQYSKSKQRKVIAYSLAQPLNFDKCKAMTMDYYCGEFLFKPTDVPEAEIAASKLNVLQLIQTIQKEDCSFDDISRIIQNDPLLSFQLLKIANSAAYAGYQSIESIDQAIARLGMGHLKNWITILSMKNISNKPKEIMESGLIRAHMAEEIAKLSPNISSQAAYTAGLLSILDCLLNRPMSELVNQITLGDEIKDALLTQTGPIGDLLSLVIAYEEGHWEEIAEQKTEGLNLSKLYIDCLTLVTEGSTVLNG